MNAQRGFFLLLVLHLAVMLAGEPERFWPLVNYSMFSHLGDIRRQKLYALRAFDEHGDPAGVQAMREALAPYPSAIDFSQVLERRDWPAACRFLRARLRGSPIRQFEVFVREGLDDRTGHAVKVSADDPC